MPSRLYFSSRRLNITLLNSIPLSVITSGSSILSRLGTSSWVILYFIGTAISAFETGLNNVGTLMFSSLDLRSLSFIFIISTIHSNGENVDATFISRVALGGYLGGGFQTVLLLVIEICIIYYIYTCMF